MKKYILFIKVDTNDADYVTSENIVDEAVISQIFPTAFYLSKKKSKWGSVSWPSGECLGKNDKSPKELYPELTEEQIEFLEMYCPHPEHGFHSIESIIMFPEETKESLL